MNKNLGQASGTPRTDLTPNPLPKVDNTRPDGEAPALVSQAVIGGVEGEDCSIGWDCGVTDEASSGVAVEADHEEEGKVVGVPEGLEALVADLVVRRGIHEDHDEKHEVTGDASRLRIVDLQGDVGSNLCETRS